MKSQFEKHGVMHLSASTINLWIAQPSLCLLKIAGFGDIEAGPAAWRGQGVDIAIGKAIEKQEFSEIEYIHLAEKIFIEKFQTAKDLYDQKKIEKEKQNIKKYVSNGLKFYKSIKEKPSEIQGKIIINIDEIDIPFIGYFDLMYKNIVRDIKTVGKTTNKLSEAHCRQVSIYSLAIKKEPWIDYISTTSVKSFRVENIKYWINQIKIASKSLEKVLSYSDDILECCQLVYPDFDHWMWNDKMKKAAHDIWKINNKT